MGKTTLERFEALWIPEPMSGCSLWLGSTAHVFGYGIFKIGSQTDGTRRNILAHRFAWELAHGPVPDGLFVLHRCDNPPCCNPRHLFLGTRKENSADMVHKCRSARGERSGGSKLTADAVREIRALAAAGNSDDEIASRFGVTASNINYVVLRKTWRHVT